MQRYRTSQIVLHWIVVAFVLVQYLTAASIGRTHHDAELGRSSSSTDLLLHDIHNRLGLLILVLLVFRIALRLRHGAPQWAAAMPGWKRHLSMVVHAALYMVLLAQALSGFIASYLWWPMASIHRALFLAFVALAALHVIGAVLNIVIFRTEAIWRMTGWRPPAGDAKLR